ncbi:uncharacterized protein LOC108627731 isoform X2 [Ceratina calcarata]|uniref:Uncharacterized protein LOC108627731 isoform X2 n=1 Tax=Ceratina calcarata TaxID=156304 RepID=A0AAJ7J4I0_9HYME|nr:uncharacterized protein LOC108627731 isoform X2 [Ceratina calcarata]
MTTRINENMESNNEYPRPKYRQSKPISTSHDNAIYATPKEKNYFTENNIYDTFHFLLCHIIVDQPEDPVQYLNRLIDDLILFRAGLKNPRLLWTEKHVDAMFKNVAPCGSDLLSLDDYKTAMKSLGIRSYDPCPEQTVPGYVNRQTFRREASNDMKRELIYMIDAKQRVKCLDSLARQT